MLSHLTLGGVRGRSLKAPPTRFFFLNRCERVGFRIISLFFICCAPVSEGFAGAQTQLDERTPERMASLEFAPISIGLRR